MANAKNYAKEKTKDRKEYVKVLDMQTKKEDCKKYKDIRRLVEIVYYGKVIKDQSPTEQMNKLWYFTGNLSQNPKSSSLKCSVPY